MSFSSLCVKNIEFAQVLMINNESLFAVVCMLVMGSGNRGGCITQ